MFHFYRGIFIILLFHTEPVYLTDGNKCSRNCTLKDGKHRSGNGSEGPPKIELITSSKPVSLKSTISLKCRLCQSNPTSTIEWLFNGKPLHFKGERMHITSTPCKETLFLLTVLTEDQGNYTCVARNKFGESNSTKEIKIIGASCSFECVLRKDGRRKVGGKKLGPPTMKLERHLKLVTTDQMVKIPCTLCTSNPPSTLTWFFNGRQLDPEKNEISVISGWCEESLYFKALKNTAGNYSCMAKNDFGQAYSTTEIRVLDTTLKRPLVAVKLEGETGTIRGNAVKTGSRINITCTIPALNCAKLVWFWNMNGKLITRNETQYREENGMNRCTRKLMIDKVMAGSKGTYQCVVIGWHNACLTAKGTNEIAISVVSCFEGFYCPLNISGVKRCPNGTFSMHRNAFTTEQCKPCKTSSRNETLMSLHPEAASIFKINCPYNTESSEKHPSSLSHGEIVAIVGSLALLVLVVILGVCFGIRNCRNYKKLDQHTSDNIPIEIPDIPRSKDVFVCYSSKNREWVHNTLLQNLRAQNFETFIDFIDFEIGLSIEKNIVNGIYGSRKTIFVLSKDSLRSYYARSELSQALAAGRQTGHQVLVILYEKCKVPEEISNIVYLDWVNERKRDKFWEKLYEAVRRPLENDEVKA
mgnify:CR=1 FL=1